jgi:hypothetical protein
MTIENVWEYSHELLIWRVLIMISQEAARKLAVEAVHWFFENKSNLDQVDLKVASGKTPRFSDEAWARLMTEAISSFYEGLELEPEDRRIASKELRQKAIEFVGPDAFKTVAFIVAAAGVRRPIEEEVEQSFEQIQQQPGQAQLNSVQDLANYVTNEMDQYVLDEVSKIKDVNDPSISQSEAHNNNTFIQQLTRSSSGISQPFAQALSSLGAAYQIKADELTRSSGFGTVGPGASGLPTGVHIGELRQMLARILRRAARGNA